MVATTPFRINFFRTLLTVWHKKLSLRYWCRQCGFRQRVTVCFGSVYPQFICEKCQAKNVIDIKYR